MKIDLVMIWPPPAVSAGKMAVTPNDWPFSIANHRFGFSISKYLGIDTSRVKV